MKILFHSFLTAFIFSARKIFFLSLLVILSEVEGLFAQPDTWMKKADMITIGAAPRNRAAGMAINGKGYIGTGWNGSTYFTGWWQYDPVKDSWAVDTAFTGNARNRTQYFSLNGKGYVIMGQDGSSLFTGTYEFDAALHSWKTVNSFSPKRYSGVGFTVGNYGYVCTGFDFGNVYYNDLWQYDQATDSWSQKASLPGLARYSAVVFSIGNYGYVGTGWSSLNFALNDFWQYNPLTNTWSQKANVPGPARVMASGFSIGNKGYMGLGYKGSGFSNNTYSDFYEYNPINDTWVPRANFVGGQRCGAVAFTINGEGYIGTGSVGYDSAFVSDLWKYTPANIPVTTFQKTYGGTSDDADSLKMPSGRQTADGGYVIVSSSKSFTSTSDLYVVKTDNIGNIQWSNRYGNTIGDDFGYDITQTTDGGYILSGQYKPFLSPAAYLIKLNSSGGITWSHAQGTALAYAANVIDQNVDGTYIAAGARGGGINKDVLLSKFDGSGNLQWSKQYGSTLSDNEAFSIQRMSSGNYIVSGHTNQAGNYDAFFIIADPNTGIGTSLVFPSANNDYHAWADETQDGNIIIAGSTQVAANGLDVFVLKCSTNGNITGFWSNTYGGSKADVARSVIPTYDGGYAVAGFTKSFGFGDNDAFLLKLNSAGQKQWLKTYGGTGDDRANNVIETGDGGFAIFGYTRSFGKGGSDIWFIKTDSLGNAGCSQQSPSPSTNSFVVSASGSLTASSITNTITPTTTTNTVSTTSIKQCINCTFPITLSQTDNKCFGYCNGTATVINASGAPPFTYVWSNAATTSAISNLCAGNYIATVTDANGCVAVDSVKILEPPQLLINNLPDTINICKGDTAFINESISGGVPPYTFSWSPSLALSCTACPTPAANPASTQSYVLTVTDSNSCGAKDTVVVAVHSVSVTTTGNKIICAGKSATLGASGASNYVWSPATGLSNPNISNPVANPSATTTYTVTGTDAIGCTGTNTVSVTVLSNPSATIAANPSTAMICSGKSILLTASGGITYSWSTGQSTASITVFPTLTTAYTATVTNSSGCTATATKTVTVNPVPIPSFSVTNVLCNLQCNGKAIATATTTPAYTYSWNPGGQTTSAATGLCAGNYSVTITDGKGCTATGTTSVTQPAALVLANTIGNAGCTCDGSISESPSGGTPPYTYLWNPTGQTTSAISNLCGGNYSVTVTDNNGCKQTQSLSVSQSTTVTVGISPPSQTICSGTVTSLSASASGNALYSWNIGQTTTSVNVSPTSTATYSVFVTNGTCSATATATVNVVPTPTVAIGGPSSICMGQTITLNGSGNGSYSWSNGQTTPLIVVSPTSSTQYSLTVTSPSYTCSATAVHPVSIVANPNASIASTYSVICAGVAVDTLIASGGVNYSWTSSPASPLPNNDTVLVSPDVTTSYTVFVGNGSGCFGISTFTLTVIPGFNPPIVSPQNSSYCLGDSILPVVATPSASATVVWVDTLGTIVQVGNTYFPPQNLPVGTYSIYCVQGTGAQCASYPTIVTATIHALPNADAGSDITICSGHTAQLTASGGTTYLWSPPTYLSSVTDASPVSSPDSAIAYQVIVADVNNCRDTDSVNVFVIVNDTCGIHIYNVLSPNGDGHNDTWWIDGINLFDDNFVEVFNRWGSSVWHGKNYDNKTVYWHGQNEQNQPLPAGTYYYVIDIKTEKRHTGWVELLR
ncbi:MAG: gliding motility-associated C-terminal domain-containing protein [Bacteroidetes bacterium]|nr:gliding motility-associated C-terminal domain-containing protein [Bacteroidota bacterium]